MHARVRARSRAHTHPAGEIQRKSKAESSRSSECSSRGGTCCPAREDVPDAAARRGRARSPRHADAAHAALAAHAAHAAPATLTQLTVHMLLREHRSCWRLWGTFHPDPIMMRKAAGLGPARGGRAVAPEPPAPRAPPPGARKPSRLTRCPRAGRLVPRPLRKPGLRGGGADGDGDAAAHSSSTSAPRTRGRARAEHICAHVHTRPSDLSPRCARALLCGPFDVSPLTGPVLSLRSGDRGHRRQACGMPAWLRSQTRHHDTPRNGSRQPRFPQAAHLASAAARVSIHARACVRLCPIFTAHPLLRKNGASLCAVSVDPPTSLFVSSAGFCVARVQAFYISECSTRVNGDLARCPPPASRLPPPCGPAAEPGA